MSILALISEVNPWAVIVAGLVHTIIGLIWFQPFLFANQWAAMTGKSLNPEVKWVPAGLLAHQLMSLILALIIKATQTTTLVDGILVGALVCLGFMATLEVGELIWEKIPFKLYLIRVGNQLIGLCIAGAILTLWK